MATRKKTPKPIVKSTGPRDTRPEGGTGLTEAWIKSNRSAASRVGPAAGGREVLGTPRAPAESAGAAVGSPRSEGGGSGVGASGAQQVAPPAPRISADREAEVFTPETPMDKPDETFTPPDSPPLPTGAGEALKRLLASLFTSKKFIALLVGLISIGVGKAGWDIDTDTITLIVGLIASYIVGQGIADKGKEAARVEVAGTRIAAALDWKQLGRIGRDIAPSVLPGRAGEIAREVTGDTELKRRVATAEQRIDGLAVEVMKLKEK